jgi:hypothetical protein
MLILALVEGEGVSFTLHLLKKHTHTHTPQRGKNPYILFPLDIWWVDPRASVDMMVKREILAYTKNQACHLAHSHPLYRQPYGCRRAYRQAERVNSFRLVNVIFADNDCIWTDPNFSEWCGASEWTSNKSNK